MHKVQEFVNLSANSEKNMKTVIPDALDPIAMIDREMKKQNLTPGVLAKKIKRHPSSVTAMLRKENTSVERLIVCSRALKYNFFQEIAYKLNYPGPADPKANPLTQTVNSLNSEIQVKAKQISDLEKKLADADMDKKLLEKELSTIKQVMKDFFAAKQI